MLTHVNLFYHIVHNKYFQRFILTVIIFSAVLIGLETYHDLYVQYHNSFVIADAVIQTIFSVEIIMRILAFGNKPLAFFKSFNNVFDFTITAIFYLPFGGTYAAIFRLARIVRIFRLFTALPQLQILVGTLIKSLPSMGYISLLLLIQLYFFAVLGIVIFGHNDPEHFGNLGRALLTLFQIITLEGWVEIMDAQPQWIGTYLYFITFILSGTMIILNLFIGVILNSFDDMKSEIRIKDKLRKRQPEFAHELDQISKEMESLSKRITSLVEKRS